MFHLLSCVTSHSSPLTSLFPHPYLCYSHPSFPFPHTPLHTLLHLPSPFSFPSHLTYTFLSSPPPSFMQNFRKGKGGKGRGRSCVGGMLNLQSAHAVWRREGGRGGGKYGREEGKAKGGIEVVAVVVQVIVIMVDYSEVPIMNSCVFFLSSLILFSISFFLSHYSLSLSFLSLTFFSSLLSLLPSPSPLSSVSLVEVVWSRAWWYEAATTRPGWSEGRPGRIAMRQHTHHQHQHQNHLPCLVSPHCYYPVPHLASFHLLSTN